MNTKVIIEHILETAASFVVVVELGTSIEIGSSPPHPIQSAASTRINTAYLKFSYEQHQILNIMLGWLFVLDIKCRMKESMA
jgi:hypothetical protein